MNNIYRLSQRLKELTVERDKLIAEGEDTMYIEIDIAEMKDRINYAWQDDEEEATV
jgi:hypothetical protein